MSGDTGVDSGAESGGKRQAGTSGTTWRDSLDLFLKLVIALAGVYGSVFLATSKQLFEQNHQQFSEEQQKQVQQNTDIQFIVNLLSVKDEVHLSLANAMATAYFGAGRIPKEIYQAVTAYVSTNSSLGSQRQNDAIASQISGASKTVAAALAVSPAPDARVYIQYADRNDKDSVEAIRQNLSGQTVDGKTVVVPPSEMVSTVVKHPILKCFRKTECDAYGAAILAAAKASGAPADTQTVYAAGYENSTTLRPMHFELWLGPLGHTAAATGNGPQK